VQAFDEESAIERAKRELKDQGIPQMALVLWFNIEVEEIS